MGIGEGNAGADITEAEVDLAGWLVSYLTKDS